MKIDQWDLRWAEAEKMARRNELVLVLDGFL